MIPREEFLVIALTRLGGKELVVNADHVLTVEATPDTVIMLTTGSRVMVKESVDEVVDRVAAWKRRVHHGPSFKATVVPLHRQD